MESSEKSPQSSRDISIKKIFHSCFLFKFGDINLLTDPFLGNNLPQGLLLDQNPVLSKEDIPKIDIILITKEHYEHFDKDLVEYFVKRDNCIVVAPKDVLLKLNLDVKSSRVVKVNDIINLTNIRITVLPCQCSKSYYPVGYLIDHNGYKIYFSGATLSLPEIKFDADVGIMPAGGKGFADYHVFVAMAKKLNLDYAIPMLYNTFSHIRIDIDKLKEKAEEKFKSTKLAVLESGQAIYL